MVASVETIRNRVRLSNSNSSLKKYQVRKLLCIHLQVGQETLAVFQVTVDRLMHISTNRHKRQRSHQALNILNYKKL